jgi:hypothetical protein
MASVERLDESDVEEMIADGDEAPPSPYGEERLMAPSDEVAAAESDSETPEELEAELEDGTPGLEEEAVHVEEAASEVLDDERDIEEEDASGAQGEELEWRMDEATEPGAEERP